MDSAIRLIEAIAKLIGSFAWPAALMLSVWFVLGKQRDAVRRLIGRVRRFSYPGGEAELVEEIEERRQAAEELQNELVAQGSKTDKARLARLAREYEEIGRLAAEQQITDLSNQLLSMPEHLARARERVDILETERIRLESDRRIPIGKRKHLLDAVEIEITSASRDLKHLEARWEYLQKEASALGISVVPKRYR